MGSSGGVLCWISSTVKIIISRSQAKPKRKDSVHKYVIRRRWVKRRISILGGKIRLRSSEGIRACHDTLYIYI